jgi:predicted dehydrogenase
MPARASAPPVGVALVGCGAVACLYHAPALAALERDGVVVVRALFDPEAAHVAELRALFPGAARVERLSELPGLGIGLAIVASPPSFHAAQATELLAAGLSMLCEKPLAPTLAEAESVVAAARSARGVAAAGLFRRFFPATQTIRALLAAGAIGDVRRFDCFEGGSFTWPARSPGFFARSGLSGGVLLDVGVHALDLLGWWWGEPAEVDYEDDAMGGIEANCRLRLTFPAGFSGEVRLSRDWALPNRYVIQGSRGWIAWEANEADRLAVGFHEGGAVIDGRLAAHRVTNGLPSIGEPAFTFEQSFTSQLANVVAAVRGSAPLVVPAEAALPSLALIERCYRHRRLMPMPWLGAEEARRARALGGAPAAA